MATVEAQMTLATVLGMARDGRWHSVVNSYPSSMDTECGKQIDAVKFVASTDPDFVNARRICAECVPYLRAGYLR